MKTISLSTLLCILLLGTDAARAGSATWALNPGASWSQFAPGNWVPNTVPNSADDVATFSASNWTAIHVVDIVVGAIVFQPGAPVYSFTVESLNGLQIVGPGITNDSGLTQSFTVLPNFDTLIFTGSATAGANTVFTANAGRFAGESGGAIRLLGDSNAGSATFISVSEQVLNGFAGTVTFGTNASAADATVIAQGSSVNKGGAVVFSDDSTAANATLIAYAGTGSGFGGGFSFSGRSTGGTMRVILFGDGTASTRNGVFGVPGQRSGVRNVSIGSIEGGGQLGLGADKMTGPNVTIGTNNLSTTFDGMISGGAQNSLTKVGIGTLTLTNGANTYSGGTNVNQGTLVVSNTSGFGAGGPIQVNTGTLGGSGTVLGPVTIAGRGAFLAPAHGTNQLATFTIQNPLTLKSGANYKYGIKANGNRIQADKVVAGGVTIESGATFSLRATIQGAPAPGTTLVAISNTSAAPIAGSFTNLPDGGLITAGGTTFRADYEGGDGNDLTLTVQ